MDFWKQVATRFKNNYRVVFDVFNGAYPDRSFKGDPRLISGEVRKDARSHSPPGEPMVTGGGWLCCCC